MLSKKKCGTLICIGFSVNVLNYKESSTLLSTLLLVNTVLVCRFLNLQLNEFLIL